MARKQEVTEEAEALGIIVKSSWTIAEIEAAIAEQQGGPEAELDFDPLTDEQLAKQREAEREREARPNAVTTSSMGIDPNVADGDNDDHETEEQVYVGPKTDQSPPNDIIEEPQPTEDQDEDKNNVKNLPTATHDELVEDNKVVVRYVRDEGSYTIGRLKFSPRTPFRVVSKEFAEKHFFDGHPDVRVATPEEVKEYYNS